MNCENCRFFDDQGDDTGFCRYGAPQPIITEETDTAQFANWPIVDINDWCGQFDPKPPEGFTEAWCGYCGKPTEHKARTVLPGQPPRLVCIPCGTIK